MASSSTNEATQTQKAAYQFEGYNKPIVLIGSSSSEGNELHRLALSLSGSLVDHNEKILSNTLDRLERSQGAILLGDEDGASSNNEGIALSAIVLDDEDGPFVLESSIIGDLVRDETLSLTSGVLVLDFNHEVFKTDKKNEAELIDALIDLAKQLYKDGFMSVYVNVHSSGMSEEAKTRKSSVENSVFIPYTDYEICIKSEGAASADSAEWNDVQWELQRIIARALLPPPEVGGVGSNSADLVMGLNTFFLSLSFPRIEEAAPYVEEMCADVDSMEYRVDLLQCSKDYLNQKSSGDESDTDPRFEILYQQQRLRAMCRPHAKRAPALPFGGASVIDDSLPIVYTVRTAHQAGTWPDDTDGIKHMFDLLELGLRSGVEVLDVESAWDASLTDKLLTQAQKRYTSLILGSHHVVGSEVTPEEAVELFRQCRMNNRAHGGKVVLSINDDGENKDQMAFEASIKASKLDSPEIPNIGLVLGKHGSYSRILNPRFTPVTHECLPAKAAPGQLTAAEIMAARFIVGQIKTEKYAILGHNIAYSVSPQMQGGAFAAVKLPHLYTRADLETVQEFVDGPIWNDDNFGGCSVTIPHKQDIIEHVDVLTDAAKEIGSVNTVIVKKDKFGTRYV
jgi:pentafunctional AROM polypeptide